MKRFVLIVTLILIKISGVYAQADDATLWGKVTDKKNGEELVGATIVIEGTTSGTITNFTGDFQMPPLKPGTYTFRCQFISYEPVLLKNIEIKPGEHKQINIALQPVELNLQEVQVVAKAKRDNETMLLLEQKEASRITESIGAKQLSAQGVSDAATAATKMTGITKQSESKTLNIRGLGDRYNATTLNELPLPSNQAEYKNINLEIFPTEVIEYVSVEKVFSPQMQADFSGANINITSRKFTGDPFFEVGVKTGVNTNAIKAKTFWVSDEASYTGFKTLKAPGSLQQYQFNRNWNPEKQSHPINSGLSLSGGRSLKTGNSSLNTFFTLSHDNEYGYSQETLKRVNGSNDPLKLLSGDSYNQNTQTTGMLNLNLAAVKNNLYFNSIFLNSASQEISNLQGMIIDVAEDGAFVRRQEFEQTTLWVNQLLGTHTLSQNFQLKWGVGINHVKNNLPDRLHNTLDGTDAQYKQFANNDIANNHRYYHTLNEQEQALNLSIDYLLPNSHNSKNTNKISIGYSGKIKSRNFEATQFNHKIITNQLTNVDNIDAFFNEANLESGLFELWTHSNAFISSSSFNGKQNSHAGYINLEYNLTPKLLTSTGLRAERVYQQIDYRTTLQTGSENFTEMNLLPAFSLRYKMNEITNLRLAASSTYTLPQFKETAPFIFDGITDATVGNPKLYPSKNYNGELKWEHFPKPGELIAVALFGKIIQNPINKFVQRSADNNFTYANTGKTARIIGAELELKKELWTRETASKTQKLGFTANTTLMHTTQNLDGEKISRESGISASFNKSNEKLQGASPIIANAGLTYSQSKTENNKSLTTSLVYGYVSESLYLIGYSYIGNQIDRPVHTLDYVAKTSYKNWALGFTAKNILNQNNVRWQENITRNPVKSSSKGLTYNISLTYKF